MAGPVTVKVQRNEWHQERGSDMGHLVGKSIRHGT